MSGSVSEATGVPEKHQSPHRAHQLGHHQIWWVSLAWVASMSCIVASWLICIKKALTSFCNSLSWAIHKHFEKAVRQAYSFAETERLVDTYLPFFYFTGLVTRLSHQISQRDFVRSFWSQESVSVFYFMKVRATTIRSYTHLWWAIMRLLKPSFYRSMGGLQDRNLMMADFSLTTLTTWTQFSQILAEPNLPRYLHGPEPQNQCGA